MNATDLHEFITLCKDAARRTKTIPVRGCTLSDIFPGDLVERLGELVRHLRQALPIQFLGPPGDVLPPEEFLTEFKFVDPYRKEIRSSDTTKKNGVFTQHLVCPGDLDRVTLFLESWISVAEGWLAEREAKRYSKCESPSKWGKVFGVHTDTFKKMVENGDIDAMKISNKLYRVNVNDLPPE